MQLDALARMVDRKIAKGRELKLFYSTIDEQSIDPYTGSARLSWTGFDTSGLTAHTCNNPIQGDRNQDRIGNTIQPVAFQFKGAVYFQGSSANMDRDSLVRIVFAFTDDNVPNVTDTIFKKSGGLQAPQGNYTDIYADFEWGTLVPFYDEVFMLTPNNYFDPVTPAVTTQKNGRAHALINVDYNFGKNARTLSFSGNSQNYLNKKNIIGMMFARNLQDDTIITTISVELHGLAKFSFYDA